MNTKVVIEVVGGIVQNVYAPKDGAIVEVEVLDLDLSDYATEEEKREVDQKESRLKEIVAGDGWLRIY